MMTRAAVTPARLRTRFLRLIIWGAVGGLIAAHAIAMLFTAEIRWGPEDFAFASVMLGGAGLAFELAVRASGSRTYRGGAGVALAAGLSLLWANAAVGIIGSEENEINMWFNIVPLLALFGAVGARFRARGLAYAMAATAVAQVMLGLALQWLGHFTWGVTIAWAAAWVVSAWLFRRAARQPLV